MRIRSRENLRVAYESLRLWETLAAMTEPAKRDLAEENIRNLKRDIRAYNQAAAMEYPHWCIDHDFDSVTEIVLLPANFTRTQVEEYYDEFMHREYRPSMYDCTGQVFSVWHVAFRVGRGWKIYHRIAMDV